MEPTAVAYVILVLLIGLANFAMGFALAVQFGHGPAWTDLLRRVRPAAADKSPAKSTPANSKPH